MKGIVLSFPKISPINEIYSTRRRNRFNLRRFLSCYGIHLAFVSVFLISLIYGSLTVTKCSPKFLSKLDFLFVTNLQQRLSLSSFSVFCSSLASGFIFIFAVFLMAFSAWGMIVLPLICAFKGFGVGISSAYLFLEYSLSGIGFYILVILPGTVLFLLSFIIALKESLGASTLLLRYYFSKRAELILQKYIRTYIIRYSYVLLLLTASALLDMILWMLFAKLFKFQG